jgi:small subunit ribosomal protein S6
MDEAVTGPSPMMKEEKSRNVTDGPAADKPAEAAAAAPQLAAAPVAPPAASEQPGAAA